MSDSFYDSYHAFKAYETPCLSAKKMRRLDRAFWRPAACAPDLAVLEVGCGTGLFLDYLRAKGVMDFLGIDRDPALADVVPEAVRGHFRAADVWEFLAAGADGRTFDRIALFDVLEHFAAEDGVRLLRGLAGLLRGGGKIVVQTPNVESPWGARYQWGDLTHRTAFNPISMRQIATAAGLVCTACRPREDGPPVRRLTDRALQAVLNRVLMTPPEIWTANFVSILERRPG